MSEPIVITPELLADIEDKCKRLMALKELETTAYYDYWRELIAPDNTLGPAVVLAMIERITFLTILLFGDMLPHDDPIFRAEELDKEVKELRDENKRLKAAQCWAIVTIETGVVEGPYATFEAAENERLAELCDDPDEPMYRVEPWKGGA